MSGHESTGSKALDYALAYARLGWPVIALRPAGSKYEDICGSRRTARGVEPASKSGFKDATTNADIIKAWYQKGPGNGVGIYPGGAGLLALDVDTKCGKRGPEQLEALQDLIGQRLPETLTQQTPSGATHLIFRLPSDVSDLGNSALPNCPDVDIRAHKGYIAAEGTATSVGKYRFLDWDPLDDADPEIAEAPKWLIDLLVKVNGQSPNSIMTQPSSQSLSVLTSIPRIDIDGIPAELKSLVMDGVPHGSRSQQFHHAVGWLKDLGYGESQVVALLNEYPRGIGEKYAGRMAAEVQRCWSKLRYPINTGPNPLEDHPLAQFIDISQEIRPPRMIIPRLIQEGLVIIAGRSGSGKTTVLVPLMLKVIGIGHPNDPLMPRHWRHVIYIAEDPDQVQRVLIGACRLSANPWDLGTVQDRFHLVWAKRLPADEAVRVGPLYRERYTRYVGDVELRPVVVMDTRSAVLDIDDENDNGAASKAVAALRQKFEGLPLIVLGHTARHITTDDRGAVRQMGVRGASAWEGDVEQTMYLVRDKTDDQYLLMGKKRFEDAIDLRLVTRTEKTMAKDEWGVWVPITVRWCEWFEPLEHESTRQEIPASDSRAEQKAQAKMKEREKMRLAILDNVMKAFEEGLPVSKTALKGKTFGNAKQKGDYIAELIDEQWLVEIEIPKEQRKNNAIRSYLIALTEEERDAYLRDGSLPSKKASCPPSVTKRFAEISLVPETRGQEEDSPPTAGVNDANPLVPDPLVLLKEKSAGTSGMGLKAPNSGAHSKGRKNDRERSRTTQNGRDLKGTVLPVSDRRIPSAMQVTEAT